MKQFIFLPTLCLLFTCASFSRSDSGSPNSPEFELVWEAGKLIRIERFKNSGMIRGRGAVKAECSGSPCSKEQVEKFAPPKIKALPKHGKWEEYLQFEQAGSTPEKPQFQSSLDWTGEYLDGKKVGVWRKPSETDPSKSIAIMPWVDGKKDGLAQSFDTEGNVVSETDFKNDKKNGPYWRKNSKGLWVEKGSFLDDEEEGVWTTYHLDEGNGIKSTCSYKLGKKQGLETNYHTNGAVESQGNYTLDARTGAWKQFNSKGVLIAEGGYSAKEGATGSEPKFERTGIWKEYYGDGKLFGTGARKHLRTGNWKFYYNNGQLAYDGIMSNESMLESAKVFNENGAPIGEGKFFYSLVKIEEETQNIKINFKPSIPFIYFYPSGKKRIVIRSAEDATEYDENGSTIGSGPVDPQGRKMGCWVVSGKKMYYMLDNAKPNFTDKQCP